MPFSRVPLNGHSLRIDLIPDAEVGLSCLVETDSSAVRPSAWTQKQLCLTKGDTAVTSPNYVGTPLRLLTYISSSCLRFIVEAAPKTPTASRLTTEAGSGTEVDFGAVSMTSR